MLNYTHVIDPDGDAMLIITLNGLGSFEVRRLILWAETGQVKSDSDTQKTLDKLNAKPPESGSTPFIAELPASEDASIITETSTAEDAPAEEETSTVEDTPVGVDILTLEDKIRREELVGNRPDLNLPQTLTITDGTLALAGPSNFMNQQPACNPEVEFRIRVLLKHLSFASSFFRSIFRYRFLETSTRDINSLFSILHLGLIVIKEASQRLFFPLLSK